MRCVIAAALGAAALIALSAASSRTKATTTALKPKPAQADAAPRGGAASDKFELVAVAQGGELVIYLDRFATNEPVRGRHDRRSKTPDGSGRGRERRRTPTGSRPPWLGKPGHYRSDRHGDGRRRHRRAAGHDRRARPQRGDDSRRRLDVPPDTAALQPATGVAARGRIPARSRGDVVSPPRGRSGSVVADDRVRRRAGAHEGHSHAPAAQVQTLADRAVRGGRRLGVCAQTDPAHFRIAHGAAEVGIAPRARSNCPAASFPTRTPAALCRPRSAAGCRAPPGGFPRLGTPVQAGRRAGPRHAADAADRRVRHAPAPGRTRPADLHRRAPAAPLRAAGAERRGRAIQLEETKLELEGLKERRAALDKVRREPEALIAPVDWRDRRGHAGRRADRAAQCGGVPDRRSGPAVDRGAELRRRGRTARRRRGDRRRPHAAAYVPRLGLGRPQPVDRRCNSRSRARAPACAPASSSPCSSDRRRREEGHRHPACQRDPHVERPGRGLRPRPPERFEAKPVRIEPLDGERVLVLAGLEPGERVVGPGRRTARPRAVNGRACSHSSSPNRCATGCWCWR